MSDYKLVSFPKTKTAIWDLYLEQVKCFWTDTEINFETDKDHLLSLNREEMKILGFILVFFKNADELVVSNINTNFIDSFKETEVNFCYSFQIAMENIHQLVYNKCINYYNFISPKFREIISEIEFTIKEKLNWITSLISQKDISLEERLIYFIFVEGVLFASSFATIFWFKERNILPSLTLSNEFISRDEGIHTRFGCELYKQLDKKLSRERILEILRETIEIETRIINMCDFNIISLSSNNLIQYIQYIGDYTLGLIGERPYYNSSNPFPFMNLISLDVKTNFFEKKNSSYQHTTNNVNHNDLSSMLSNLF